MKRLPDKNSLFGDRLRGLRSERGLSMDQLCDQINRSQKAIRLNRSTIYRYEKGLQEPMLSTVAAIASFFGVSPVFLIGESDDRSPLQAPAQSVGTPSMFIRSGSAHERELGENEIELLRIYEALDVKGRHALMSAAFDLEEKQKNGGK